MRLVALLLLLCLCSALRLHPQSLAQRERGSKAARAGAVGGAVAAILLSTSQLVSARESKLDFDQRIIETRPSATDAAPSVSTGMRPDYAALRRDIKDLVETKPEKGPTLVRLAWHSSGTYDKMQRDGGSSKGTIRFREELAHGANAGLDTAIAWLEPLYKKYNKASDLSYADLFTLAGVVAIRALNGPEIHWRAGRVDSLSASDVTADGRLPDADKGSRDKTAAGLRAVFNRMGFEDQEIVALSGAHALGRCHPTSSGYVGPWTFTPQTFDNQYFVLLRGLKWSPDPKATKLQYTDPSGKLMMLPSDLVLIEDSGFAKYVDAYAKDKQLFFRDFSAAFEKLLELGTSNLYDV